MTPALSVASAPVATVTSTHVDDAVANAPIESVPLSPPAAGNVAVCGDVLGVMHPVALAAASEAGARVGLTDEPPHAARETKRPTAPARRADRTVKRNIEKSHPLKNAY